MPGSYTKLLYHVVFSTKRRIPHITPEIEARLHEYLGGIIRSERGAARRIGGTSDHVHILFRWRADAALSALMRNLKSHSSGWVHRTFSAARDFAWQEGYAAFTVSPSRAPAVEGYIEKQAEHHRKRDFQAELIALLDAHGIEYDKRYLRD